MTRRGDRVVEGARLEIVCALTGTAGSNPALSAGLANSGTRTPPGPEGSNGSDVICVARPLFF